MGFATVTGLTSNFWHQSSFADAFVSEKIGFSKSPLGREYSLRVLRHFEENKNWVKSSWKTWTGPKLNISWSLKSLECFLPPPTLITFHFHAPLCFQHLSKMWAMCCWSSVPKRGNIWGVYFDLLTRKKFSQNLRGNLSLSKYCTNLFKNRHLQVLFQQ